MKCCFHSLLSTRRSFVLAPRPRLFLGRFCWGAMPPKLRVRKAAMKASPMKAVARPIEINSSPEAAQAKARAKAKAKGQGTGKQAQLLNTDQS